jgi:orotate phosphoribosyltransferase
MRHSLLDEPRWLWNVPKTADKLRRLANKTSETLSKSASRARLHDIIRRRSFGRGEVTLASGRKSDFYFNLKPTMLDPEGAALLAELTYESLREDQLDYIGGLEMGAVPLAGAIAQLSWLKGHPIAAFFVRKKPKEHGARLSIEGLAKGESLEGKRVVVVEDVTTTGGSAMKAVEALRETGANVVLVLTMVDREEGASDTFAQAGLPFRSIYKASEFLRE